MPRTCIIVPTIRQYECMEAYYENARKFGFDLSQTHTLLITEDNQDKAKMQALLDKCGVKGQVFNHTDRLKWFADHKLPHSDVIPKRSHAETSFGLLWMQAHPEFEHGVFIDDDTLPLGHDYFGGHAKNLQRKGSILELSSSSRWVNVLYKEFAKQRLYPRGYPYSAMHETISRKTRPLRDVVASQGLWTNVPDLDAVRILMDGDMNGQARTRTAESDFGEDFVVADGHYLTVCSMNLAFKREVIPAFYQLPMDDNQWRIGRFDDIWSGVFLKRAADVMGKDIVTGRPLCEHNKAPRPTFKDLHAEAPALELNEHIWELAEEAQPSKDWSQLYLNMADTVAAASKKHKWSNVDYLDFMAKHMRNWVEVCQKIG